MRTWALLLTSAILYIPANLLPIMETESLGNTIYSTILGGVVLLWNMGSYPVAMVIFIASVLVPIAKILSLFWLCYTVSRGDIHHKRGRTRLYRLTEFVGRWSMVDVFVVAVLAALDPQLEAGQVAEAADGAALHQAHRARVVVGPHGFGAVAVHRLAQPRGQQVEGLVPADRLPLVADTAHRLAQAVRVVLDVLQGHRFRADMATAEAVLGIALDRQDMAAVVAVLGFDGQAADGLTQVTGTVMEGLGHGLASLFCSRRPVGS